MSRRRTERPDRHQRVLALDLGSTMTRFCVVGEEAVTSHPTLLLADRTGEPVAAGWGAWHMAVDEPHRLHYPVLGGVVFDVTACANLLRLLLAEEGLGRLDGVAVAVPAVATREDISLLAGVLGVATGAPVISMRPALAAAAGRDNSAGDVPDGIVFDIGASVVEVGAFYGRRLGVQTGIKLRTHAFLDEPELVVGELLRLVHKVLGQVPGTIAARLVAAPATFIGGAQQSRPLLEQVCNSLHLDISIADDPETAVVTGLARSVNGTLNRAQS